MREDYNKLAATLRWFTAGGAIRITLRQLLQNRKWRHLWRHNLGLRWKLQKKTRENFSIGALYNITKNQDNPIETVGRDSFLSPKPLKIQVFRGHEAPGVAQPLYSTGHNYIQKYNTCPSLIEIGSKTAKKNSAQKKQTNRQTDRQTNQQTLRK